MRFSLPSSISPSSWLICCGVLAALSWGGCGGEPAKSGGQAGAGGQGNPGGSGGAIVSTGSGGASSVGGSATTAGSGGTLGTGGRSGTAGSPGSGGSSPISASGGATGGTSVGSGGVIGAGGRTAGTGGAGPGGSGTGGRATGGSSGSGSGGSGSGGSAAGGSTGTIGACGSTTLNQHPFGCKFAWGIASPSGSLASYSYLQFVSSWVDSAISAAGTFTTCNGCNWLTKSVAGTNLIPVYYGYIIGFMGHANGIVDGNQTGSQKLTNAGAAFIKANRAAIISAYSWYAEKTAAAWPSKPLVWLLEGDFVQYAATSQSSPLSYVELGQLAADITCAIKSKMPNAVVAIDQSSWNDDATTNSFWGAMTNVNYDMVWTTGVGDNNGYLASGTTSSTYNAKTATYAYLHQLTGRTILVDTSAGASAAGDSWSTAGLTNLNARIAEGVIAANITGTAPTGLQTNISGLASVSPIPSCP